MLPWNEYFPHGLTAEEAFREHGGFTVHYRGEEIQFAFPYSNCFYHQPKAWMQQVETVIGVSIQHENDLKWLRHRYGDGFWKAVETVTPFYSSSHTQYWVLRDVLRALRQSGVRRYQCACGRRIYRDEEACRDCQENWVRINYRKAFAKDPECRFCGQPVTKSLVVLVAARGRTHPIQTTDVKMLRGYMNGWGGILTAEQVCETGTCSRRWYASQNIRRINERKNIECLKRGRQLLKEMRTLLNPQMKNHGASPLRSRESEQDLTLQS